MRSTVTITVAKARPSFSTLSSPSIEARTDRNTVADWIVIDAHHVQLRAERAGTGDGRVCTIAIGCTDGSGNRASSTAAVRVPK